MRQDVRDRLVLPVLLPIGILVLIGTVLWGFSRILLGVTATAATITAIAVAGAILAIASIAAGRTTIRGSTIAAMFGATAGAAMLVGGIALAVVGGGEGPEGPEAVVRLSAQDIAFHPTSLTAPAAEPFTIAFDNRDTVEHNVHIFDNADHSGTALFEGAVVAASTQANYRVEPLEAGTYYFQCTIHPQMTGELEAAEGAGPGPGGPGGPGATIRAVPTLTFDTAEITLPADQPSTLTFDNQDAGVQHNVSIYAGEGGESLFEGEVITGPAQTEYPIPPLPAGEAYFQCDIHPTMNGTVRVE
jgi:plastocyanin